MAGGGETDLTFNAFLAQIQYIPAHNGQDVFQNSVQFAQMGPFKAPFSRGVCIVSRVMTLLTLTAHQQGLRRTCELFFMVAYRCERFCREERTFWTCSFCRRSLRLITTSDLPLPHFLRS